MTRAEAEEQLRALAGAAVWNLAAPAAEDQQPIAPPTHTAAFPQCP